MIVVVVIIIIIPITIIIIIIDAEAHHQHHHHALAPTPAPQVCSFVIVPGPSDPSPIDAFPRPPLPPSVLKQFTEKVSFTLCNTNPNPQPKP
jgi:hypothetical protein